MTDLTSEDLKAHFVARVAAFRPLSDQLLVELEPAHPEKTPGGLFIPQTVSPDEMGVRYARVVAAGPGRKLERSAARAPMSCKVGDRVILDEICLRGPFPEICPGFHVTHDEQILAVVEE